MNPSNWTAEDVASQLRQMGLGKYQSKIIDNDIDGPALYSINDATLRSLGFIAPHRVQMMNWLQTLPAPGKKTATKTSGRQPANAGRSANPARPKLGDGGGYNDEYEAPPARKTTATRTPGASSGTRTTGAGARATAAAPAKKTVAQPKQTAASAARAAAAPKAEPKAAPARATGPPKRGAGPRRGFEPSSMPNVPEYEDDANDDRVPCRYCGRKFAQDRIDKHEDACATASKKRRVFNSTKQRLAGTEAEGYARRVSKQPAKPHKEMINGKPKYKVEHENLVAALRAARKMTKYQEDLEAGRAVGPPPKMPEIQDMPDDRVQCPYCGRKFGEEQYERHRRFCEPKNVPIPRSKPARRGAAAAAPKGRGRR